MEQSVLIENKLVMTSALRWQLMFDQRGRCAICKIEEWRLKKRLQAHRIVPGKYGGKYIKDNIILVCPKCHNHLDHKGNKK